MRVVMLATVIVAALTAAAVAVSPGTVGENPRSSISTGLLCAILALPHALYASIWWQPQVWLRMLGPGKQLTLDRFSTFAKLLKPFQFVCYISWWSAMLLPDFKPDLIFYGSATAGILLIIFGQVLNFGTYKALGTTGVYYGSKFGFDIPWVEGFPFNVVRHPQYVGCVITIWGVFLFLWPLLSGPWLLGAVTVYWTTLYAFSAVWEEHF